MNHRNRNKIGRYITLVLGLLTLTLAGNSCNSEEIAVPAGIEDSPGPSATTTMAATATATATLLPPTATPTPNDTPPVITIYAPISSIVGEQVVLDASATLNHDSDPITATWTQVHLPDRYDGTEYISAVEVELQNPDSLIAVFAPTWPGIYRFRLEVSDDDGTSATVIDIPVSPHLQSLKIEGIAISPYWDPHFGGLSTVQQITDVGANFVELNPIWYMPDPASTEVRPLPERGDSGNSISDERLIELIEASHEIGLRVFLKPMVEFDNYIDWRGNLQPVDWNAWFENYTVFILHYAQIAQDTNVEILSVGAELMNSIVYSEQWEDVIARVRGIYDGKLTYSEEVPFLSPRSRVTFWGSLDYISTVFYYPSNGSNFEGVDLTLTNPTVMQMTTNFERILALAVDPLVEEYGLPVLFTEGGVRNCDGCSVTPWEWRDEPGLVQDNAEQSSYYEAAFIALHSRPWIEGIFWWEYISRAEAPLAPWSLYTYDPRRRPAEEVVSLWYQN